MNMHLQKCIGCPGSVEDLLKEITKFKREHYIVLKTNNSEIEDMISDDEKNGAMIQSSDNVYYNDSVTENNLIDRMSNQRQKYCEELLAKAIYASNAPVSIIDNEH